MTIRLLLFLIIVSSFTSTAYAVNVAPRITDREIIEALVAIRGDIREIRGDIKRLEQRIDGLDQRMDRLESDLKGFMMWGFGILFSGMLILVGFILWDRRTTLAPVVKEIKEKESEIAEVKRRERELERKESLLEDLLRGYAKEEPRMATLMRAKGLL